MPTKKRGSKEEQPWITDKTGKIKLSPVKGKQKSASDESFTFALFDDLLEEAFDKGIEEDDIRDSVSWFFNKIQRSKYGDADDIMKARSRMKSGIEYGRMYFFSYEAKHAKTLPYWDKFPLIFPIDPKPGGFLGINLHYLPQRLRMALMKELYDLAASGRYDAKTKLVISYKILKSVVASGAFKPCVKWYLTKQLRSPFIQINYPEWAMAAALPVQQFEKASERKVWADSKKKITGG